MALGDYLQGSAGRGSALAPTRTSLKPTLTAAPNAKTAAKTAVTKTTVTPDPFAKALAAQPSLATLLAQASHQANILAQQQVNAQVAAIQQQQDQAHATAAAQSAEILKAATAAAQFLTPLGDQARDDYTAAVNNLGGMVGGYTGGLRDTAQAAQDAAQAQLAGISGNTQTVEGHGADLANLLYGVSGSIPANALATQGLGATALARAIPQQTLSYGQQQAIGQIGEGNKTADALNADLITARGKLPDLTSTYLKQFQDSAQNVADQAHQNLMDANTFRNTTSLIKSRTATGKRLTKAAADKAKADAAKLMVPDATQTKLAGGILTSVSGKPITKTVKGVQFLQTAPGYHFDSTGHSIPDPKQTDPAKIAKLALDWSTHLHYRADSAGNALLFHGKKQPLAPYILDPNDPTGQTVMPRTAAAKPFMPKPIEIDHKYAYVGEDKAIHFFKDANNGTIPWPEKDAPMKLINSGGHLIWVDPNTRKTYAANDDNGVPLIAGTPKGPPATHYSGRYPGADGFYHVYNTATAQEVTLTTRVPPKVASKGTWSPLSPDKFGHVYLVNSKTGAKKLLTGVQGRIPGQSTGTWTSYLGPNGNRWRINNKTNAKIDTGQKWKTPGGEPGGESPLTPTQLQDHGARLNAALDRMQHGWVEHDPTAGDITHAPYTRAEAYDALIHQSYFSSPQMKRLAMKLLNRYFPKPGTVVSRVPAGKAGLGVIPRIPSDIIGGPPGAYG